MLFVLFALTAALPTNDEKQNALNVMAGDARVSLCAVAKDDAAKELEMDKENKFKANGYQCDGDALEAAAVQLNNAEKAMQLNAMVLDGNVCAVLNSKGCADDIDADKLIEEPMNKINVLNAKLFVSDADTLEAEAVQLINAVAEELMQPNPMVLELNDCAVSKAKHGADHIDVDNLVESMNNFKFVESKVLVLDGDALETDNAEAIDAEELMQPNPMVLELNDCAVRDANKRSNARQIVLCKEYKDAVRTRRRAKRVAAWSLSGEKTSRPMPCSSWSEKKSRPMPWSSWSEKKSRAKVRAAHGA